MNTAQCRTGSVGLIFLLVVAVVVLVLQIFPSLLSYLDIRRWSWLTLVLVNLGFLVIVVAVQVWRKTS